MLIWGRATDTDWKQLWRDLHFNNLYLIGFIGFCALGGFAYMLAVQDKHASTSAVTAISSTYPAVTMLILCLFYKEYEKLDLRLALPGVALAASGAALIAIAPKPT